MKTGSFHRRIYETFNHDHKTAQQENLRVEKNQKKICEYAPFKSLND